MLLNETLASCFSVRTGLERCVLEHSGLRVVIARASEGNIFMQVTDFSPPSPTNSTAVPDVVRGHSGG
jgi:hypothetical protein